MRIFQAKSGKIPWQNWLRVAGKDGAPLYLSGKHIYILPTRYGLLYALMLLCMLLGSINYALSLGFVLTFLLVGVGQVSMLHAWRNLAQLELKIINPNPVFAGEIASFELQLLEPKQRARYAINAQFSRPKNARDTVAPQLVQQVLVAQQVPASGQTSIKLALATHKRGWLTPPRIKLDTEFPLSLFYVWAYVQNSNAPCLVYPKPSAQAVALPDSREALATGHQGLGAGDDDFAGLRPYQASDSPNRIDWKASSREQGLYSKQFQGQSASLWLEWAATPAGDMESRISVLTRWVMEADAAGYRYGLRLPNSEITPATGAEHYAACLQALALYS